MVWSANRNPSTTIANPTSPSPSELFSMTRMPRITEKTGTSAMNIDARPEPKIETERA